MCFGRPTRGEKWEEVVRKIWLVSIFLFVSTIGKQRPAGKWPPSQSVVPQCNSVQSTSVVTFNTDRLSQRVSWQMWQRFVNLDWTNDFNKKNIYLKVLNTFFGGLECFRCSWDFATQVSNFTLYQFLICGCILLVILKKFYLVFILNQYFTIINKVCCLETQLLSSITTKGIRRLFIVFTADPFKSHTLQSFVCILKYNFPTCTCLFQFTYTVSNDKNLFIMPVCRFQSTNILFIMKENIKNGRKK